MVSCFGPVFGLLLPMRLGHRRRGHGDRRGENREKLTKLTHLPPSPSPPFPASPASPASLALLALLAVSLLLCRHRCYLLEDEPLERLEIVVVIELGLELKRKATTK